MKTINLCNSATNPRVVNVYEQNDLAKIQAFAKTIDQKGIAQKHAHSILTGTAAGGVGWSVYALPTKRHRTPKRIQILSWNCWVEPEWNICNEIENLFKEAGFEVRYDEGFAN